MGSMTNITRAFQQALGATPAVLTVYRAGLPAHLLPGVVPDVSPPGVQNIFAGDTPKALLVLELTAGSATVALQGSNEPADTDSWVTIGTATTNGGTVSNTTPYMFYRINQTAATTPTGVARLTLSTH